MIVLEPFVGFALVGVGLLLILITERDLAMKTLGLFVIVFGVLIAASNGGLVFDPFTVGTPLLSQLNPSGNATAVASANLSEEQVARAVYALYTKSKRNVDLEGALDKLGAENQALRNEVSGLKNNLSKAEQARDRFASDDESDDATILSLLKDREALRNAKTERVPAPSLLLAGLLLSLSGLVAYDIYLRRRPPREGANNPSVTLDNS